MYETRNILEMGKLKCGNIWIHFIVILKEDKEIPKEKM